MSTDLKYPTQVFWSSEDEAFIAIAPDLPGASAIGATKQEALAELDDAIAAWIEAALAAGNEVPTPSVPLAARPAYSGRVALRLPALLHERAAKQAALEGSSLNQWLCVAIAEQLGVHRVQRQPAINEANIVFVEPSPGPLEAGAGTVFYHANFARHFLLVNSGNSAVALPVAITIEGDYSSPRLTSAVSSTSPNSVFLQ